MWSNNPHAGHPVLAAQAAMIAEPRFPTLSIVVPLYNEQGNIAVLAEHLGQVLNTLDTDQEVILVDDGSADATWADIVQVVERYADFRGVRLSRNFGHQPALLAGLSMASGAAVISMDGDLQHPPELIPRMLQAWREGHEVVTTRRLDSERESLFKRISSRGFYRIFSWLSGVRMHQGSSDFRLLDRRVLTQILSQPSHEVFLRGMVEWVGFRRITLTFQARPRYQGRSKYSLGKMIRFGVAGLVSFSSKPLILGIWMGTFTSLLSFGYLCYAVIQYFRGITLPGWASTIGVLSLLFGVLFLLLGVIGLYLARIHDLLTGRPAFIIAEVQGVFSAPEDRQQA